MRIKQPEIIYEDEAIIVCRKEAGVAVQTARAGQADVVSLLKNYRAKKKEEPYIGLIHRLDQPVEGVMVFAKTPQATAKLSAQVSSRSMEKEYLAVTTGVPEPQKGELRDWLLRDGKTNTSAVVARGTSQAKEAVLDYEVEQVLEDAQQALVHIWLHTGRHHQIRVQFAHAGYPLVGDTKYGKPEQVLSGGAVFLPDRISTSCDKEKNGICDRTEGESIFGGCKRYQKRII